MSRFKHIDDKLTDFAKKIEAKISKDRPDFPRELINFEERRIDWTENLVRKAILIQPNFESTGVNSTIWNFTNIAWTMNNGVAIKPGWTKKLVDKGSFEFIESNIDELLNESRDNLSKIQITDVLNQNIDK
jgi:hypothetical protein